MTTEINNINNFLKNGEIVNRINNMDWKDGVKLIEPKSVDLLISDVPYGMKYQSNARKEKHLKIKDDDNIDWLPEWIECMDKLVKDDAHMYIFCSFHKIKEFIEEIKKYREVKNVLIWYKGGGGMGDLEGDYAPCYEFIIFCSNGNKKLNGKRDSNVIEIGKTQNENHPTEKPVELFRYLILKSSKEGDLVLDTFGGSFPALQACIEINRDAIVFEIEKVHCEKAKKLVERRSQILFKEL